MPEQRLKEIYRSLPDSLKLPPKEWENMEEIGASIERLIHWIFVNIENLSSGGLTQEFKNFAQRYQIEQPPILVAQKFILDTVWDAQDSCVNKMKELIERFGVNSEAEPDTIEEWDRKQHLPPGVTQQQHVFALKLKLFYKELKNKRAEINLRADDGISFIVAALQEIRDVAIKKAETISNLVTMIDKLRIPDEIFELMFKISEIEGIINRFQLPNEAIYTSIDISVESVRLLAAYLGLRDHAYEEFEPLKLEVKGYDLLPGVEFRICRLEHELEEILRLFYEEPQNSEEIFCAVLAYSGHFTMVIVNPVLKEVEFFDPARAGADMLNQAQQYPIDYALFRELHNSLSRALGEGNFVMKFPDEIRQQHLGGFCGIFSVMTARLRLQKEIELQRRQEAPAVESRLPLVDAIPIGRQIEPPPSKAVKGPSLTATTAAEPAPQQSPLAPSSQEAGSSTSVQPSLQNQEIQAAQATRQLQEPAEASTASNPETIMEVTEEETLIPKRDYSNDKMSTKNKILVVLGITGIAAMAAVVIEQTISDFSAAKSVANLVIAGVNALGVTGLALIGTAVVGVAIFGGIAAYYAGQHSRQKAERLQEQSRSVTQTLDRTKQHENGIKRNNSLPSIQRTLSRAENELKRSKSELSVQHSSKPQTEDLKGEQLMRDDGRSEASDSGSQLQRGRSTL